MSATTKIKSFASLFAFLPALFGQPAAHAPEPPVITVLCYHTYDASVKTAFNLSSRRFDEQLRYLYVQKIPVISMQQYLDHREKNTPLPERSVIITIDDGYKTAKTIAWPILKKYKFPFVLYVYPQAISRLPSALTWEDLKEMSAAGVEIQSHSLTHPLLTHPGKAMSRADYVAWLDQELQESKARLESHLGKPVTSLAYPYGGYDELIVERTRQAGYKVALTCDDQDVTGKSDALLLGRRLVFRGTSKKAFVQYFRSKPIEVAELNPRDGERTKGIPTEIRAKILNIKDIIPESAQILVDKFGKDWHVAPIDAKTGELRFIVPKKDRHGFHFVTLVARDRLNPALQREASWSFIVKRNVSKN